MAIAQVEEFVSQLDLETKGISKKISSIYSTGDSDYTKANENGYQSPFVYVVNFADDMGFALVSGDTRMPPILAMIDNGNLPEGTVINVPRTFENFGYTSGGQNESYNYDLLIERIEGGPAYVSGYSKKTTKTFLGITVKTTYDGGHAWVIDETLERRRQCIKYINGEKNSTQTQYQRLVHCNFGWEGEHNGYYYSADFNTNEDPVLKSTNVSNDQESGYYQYLLNMNTGIKG